MAVYGYARVSTDGQSLTAQLAELKAANCEKVFQEKISGARSDRKQLARLMATLAKGDVLVVTRLDRLARSTRDLLNLLGTIAEKGAGFGAGMFEDLAAAFEGSRKIKIEEQQAQKTRRQDDHHVAGSGRPDLESGVIRIRRPQDEDPTPPT